MIIFNKKTNGCWVPPFLETSIYVFPSVFFSNAVFSADTRMALAVKMLENPYPPALINAGDAQPTGLIQGRLDFGGRSWGELDWMCDFRHFLWYEDAKWWFALTKAQRLTPNFLNLWGCWVAVISGLFLLDLSYTTRKNKHDDCWRIPIFQ